MKYLSRVLSGVWRRALGLLSGRAVGAPPIIAKATARLDSFERGGGDPFYTADRLAPVFNAMSEVRSARAKYRTPEPTTTCRTPGSRERMTQGFKFPGTPKGWLHAVMQTIGMRPTDADLTFHSRTASLDVDRSISFAARVRTRAPREHLASSTRAARSAGTQPRRSNQHFSHINDSIGLSALTPPKSYSVLKPLTSPFQKVVLYRDKVTTISSDLPRAEGAYKPLTSPFQKECFRGGKRWECFRGGIFSDQLQPLQPLQPRKRL